MSNANEFLNELGETLSKTAQGLGERVGGIYETQRIRTRISSERRIVQKAMADIGAMIYAKYEEGETLNEEFESLCEEIKEHLNVIESLKEDEANKKGKKICPACKKAVDSYVSFCPFCGAAVPDPEPKEEAAEEPEEADEFVDPEDEVPADQVPAEEAPE
ncbi:MAG: zinc ribbon domain-containing protein, partial [Eubacteriales bacterium]|nr:zinc ribbon domain-containing protein [Eubacteriales bacterium]